MAVTYLNPSTELAPLIAKTFPNYKGRKFRVSATERPVNTISSWCGGSKDFFVLVNLATMETQPVPENGNVFTPALNRDGVIVPPNFVIVEHTIFCGKDLGLTFHVHPGTMAPMLMAPQIDLNRQELIVLAATRALKNSYGGETNIRYREAHTYTGITIAEWETAKASVTAKGLLNKAGAITTEGRNAVGETEFRSLKS
jgi:DNA-directed RNA polymerase subunit K/omega